VYHRFRDAPVGRRHAFVKAAEPLCEIRMKQFESLTSWKFPETPGETRQATY
jgi:hypothetical protein